MARHQYVPVVNYTPRCGIKRYQAFCKLILTISFILLSAYLISVMNVRVFHCNYVNYSNKGTAAFRKLTCTVTVVSNGTRTDNPWILLLNAQSIAVAPQNITMMYSNNPTQQKIHQNYITQITSNPTTCYMEMKTLRLMLTLDNICNALLRIALPLWLIIRLPTIILMVKNTIKTWRSHAKYEAALLNLGDV